MESADIVIVVLDGSEKLTDEDQLVLKEVEGKSAIAVINKSDLPRNLEVLDRPQLQVSLSCRTGDGLDSLKSTLSHMVKQGTVRAREHAWAVNQRHKDALERSGISLERSLESINAGLSPEFIAVDFRDALDSLGLIIGATYTEDILERIFNDFCIGK